MLVSVPQSEGLRTTSSKDQEQRKMKIPAQEEIGNSIKLSFLCLSVPIDIMDWRLPTCIVEGGSLSQSTANLFLKYPDRYRETMFCYGSIS